MILGILVFILCLIFGGILYFFRYFSYKNIILLFLGGGFLLAILQILYFSIGHGFNIDLFFLKGDLQINDFISNIENSSKIAGFGLFAILFSLVIPACLEEIGKFYFFEKINKKIDVVKSINTSIFAIAYVAMGFSFFETLVYIYVVSEFNSFIYMFQLVIVRGFVSTFSHISFSVIIGYFYAKAIFLKFHIIDNLEITKTTKLLKKLNCIPFLNIKLISKLYYLKYIIIGFSLSIFMHAIYNFFMKTNNVFLAIITVLIGILIFIKLIQTKSYNKNYLDLKTKIQNLQEIKRLKGEMKNMSK